MTKNNTKKTLAMAAAAAAVTGGTMAVTGNVHADTVNTQADIQSQTQDSQASDLKTQQDASRENYAQASKANTKAQSDLQNATNANNQAQMNVNNVQTDVKNKINALTNDQADVKTKSKGVDTATKNQEAAKSEVTKVTAEVNKDGKYQQDLTNAQKAVDQAQTKKDAAETKVKNAQTNVNTKQGNVDSATASLKKAQSALDDARGDHKVVNTINISDVAAYKKYFKDMYDNNQPTDADKVAIKKMHDENTFKADPADEKITVNKNNLTESQQLELTRFAADLLNQVREQLGVKPVQITTGSLKFATDVKNNYLQDNWNKEAHDVAGITRAARKNGLDDGGNYYEDASFFSSTPSTLAGLKGQIYDSIRDMILGFVDFNVDGNADTYEILHTEGLLGSRQENIGHGTLQDFAVQVSVLPSGWTMVHYFNITTADIPLGGGIYQPSNVVDAAKYDKTVVSISANSDLSSLEKAVQTATANLNSAKSALQNAQSALQSAKHDQDAAIASLKQAKKSLQQIQSSKPDLASAQHKLDEANKALDQAKQDLDAAKTKVKNDQAALTQAKKDLTNAEKKAKQTNKSFTLAKAKADQTAKVLQEAKDALITDAKVYGQSIAIKKQTVHQNGVDELTKPKIANPMKADPTQSLVLASFLAVANSKLDTIPTGTAADWNDSTKVMKDLQTIGDHSEDVLVTFPDYSTTRFKLFLLVLAALKTNTQHTTTPSHEEQQPGTHTNTPTAKPNYQQQSTQPSGNQGQTSQINGDNNVTVKPIANEVENSNEYLTVEPTKDTVTTRSALNNGQLPQTGNKSETGLVGLGLATMLAMFGLVDLRRKN